MKNATPPQNLRSICQNRPSFKTKFAELSFYKINYSSWTETSILLIEYLQITSQIIPSLNPENYNSSSNTNFSRIIIPFFKLLSPSHLFECAAIFTPLLCMTIFKLALFGYVFCISFWDSHPNSWLVCIWRWTFKLQTRVMYFIFTSFWVKCIIEVQENGFKALGLSHNSLICLTCAFIAIEFLFSLTLETQFSYVLPTQNLLSSKNNTLQILTLFQKLSFQILALIFGSSSSSLAWIMSTLGIAISIVRDYQFTTKLPLYNLKALFLQRALLCLVIFLSLVHFLDTILHATTSIKANVNFLILTWIICSLFSIKIAHERLKAKILSLLSSNQENTPEILLHKVLITQQFLQEETSSHLSENVSEAFAVPADNSLMSQRTSQEALSLLYFEGLLARFPENSLVKLHAALACHQNSEPIPKTLEILSELSETPTSSSIKLTSSLLEDEIRKSILRNSEEEEDLQLSQYLKSKVYVEKLKENILKQTDLYIKVCKNVVGEASNIEEIYHSAQEISKLKLKIQNKINNLPNKIPESYISPYLYCAEFYREVNHSRSDFEKFLQLASLKLGKYQRFFKDPNLLPENLYQESNAFLLLSTQKTERGKILYHSGSLENLCGTLSQRHHISELFSPSLQLYYEGLFKQSVNTLIEKTHKAYLLQKSKDSQYLVEANFYLKYHPYWAQGLCLDMIIRPVLDKKAQFLLIKQNGEIEGASKEIAEMLNLTEKAPSSLKLVSDDLYNAHLAFDIVSLNKSSEHMTEEKALEIHTAFTTEDQKVQLSSFDNNHPSDPEPPKSRSFYARIQPITYGDITLKLVTLRPIIAESHLTSHDNSEINFNLAAEDKTTLFADDNNNSELLSSVTRQSLVSQDISPTAQDDQRLLISMDSSSDHKVEAKSHHHEPAITKKTYPKSFILFFYGVIALIFAPQVIMKLASDKTMHDLQIKKDLLKYSQERSYKAALIQINALGAALTLKQNSSNPGATAAVMHRSIAHLEILMKDMKAANDEILKQVYSLDSELQRQLFEKNIKISGMYVEGESNFSPHNVTAFQAVQEIVNAVMKLHALVQLDFSKVAQMFEYLSANIMDDFQYQSREANNLFIKSIEEQKDSYQSLIGVCLKITPPLLFGIATWLIFVIWNQHKDVKKNMEAFVKISPSGVQEVLNRALKFRESLTISESQWLSNLNKNLEFASSETEQNSLPSYSKRHNARIIHSKEFSKRYLNYIFKVIFCVTPLITSTIWDLIFTQKAIEVIYHKQSQSQYANYIEDRVTSSYTALTLLYSSNNTMPVEHEPASKAVSNGCQEMKEIQSEIFTKFLETDHTYNPEIKKILFDSNPECEGFTPDSVIYCQMLNQRGQNANMIAALYVFQSLLETKFADFINADKSTMASILKAATLNMDTFLSSFTVVTNEAKMISDIIDKSITEEIVEGESARIMIMSKFSIILIGVSALLWFKVLRVIRESEDEFKRVLQMFPLNLVMANHSLKKFLQNTEKKELFDYEMMTLHKLQK